MRKEAPYITGSGNIRRLYPAASSLIKSSAKQLIHLTIPADLCIYYSKNKRKIQDL